MKHCSIPRDWTGDEALAFVALLDRLSQAIWRAHGFDMARCLQNLGAGHHAHCTPLPGRVTYDNSTRFDHKPKPSSREVTR